MPVVRNRDDDGVDVLVVEDLPQVLLVAGLEGGDLVEHGLVVRARGEQVAVDVAEGLDLDVLQLREAALQRVALAVNPDARDHDAVVGAEDAAADVRRRAGEWAEHVGGDHARGSRSDARREIAPRDAVLIRAISCHANLLLKSETPDRRMVTRAGQGCSGELQR